MLTRAIAAVVVAQFLPACSTPSTASASRQSAPPAATTRRLEPEPPRPPDPVLVRDLSIDPAFFVGDTEELADRGRVELTKVASWLQRRPGSRLRIEASDDGELRRAAAITSYLMRLGIERERLEHF